MENENNEVLTDAVVEEQNEQNENNDEVVTMTKVEFEKKLQGEGDKVRTKMTKTIRELEAKIKELTPIEKTETELALEKRIADIEAREKRMNLIDSLSRANLSRDFADYLVDGADVSKFNELFQTAVDNAVSNKLKADGYNPAGHKTGESLTKEEFRKMSMNEKERLYLENPELYKTLAGR